MSVTQAVQIADMVRETRQHLGLTQEEFALKLGVSYQSVNRWENGRTKPLPIAINRIKQILSSTGDQGFDLLLKYFPDDAIASSAL